MIDKQSNSENSKPQEIKQLALHHFAIQLNNVVPIEIVAKRYPIEIITNVPVNMQLNIESINVNSDNHEAQTITNLNIEPSDPKPFEILIKIVAIFSYSTAYNDDKVKQYLQEGSISVLLPFMRELVVSLCMRLQIPVVMLPLVHLTNPDEENKDIKNPSHSE